MQVEQDRFVEEWGNALIGGTAAVFIGSGVSLEAGYPSWSGLMARYASDLKITLRPHDDLTVIAQHYLNLGESKRSEVKRGIAAQLPEGKPIPAALGVLSRLPLRSLWTTNYDRLIEAAWRKRRLVLDTKRRKSDLAHPTAHADAVLYKMHGCASDPDSLVVAKDDYDLYMNERESFFTALAADLMGKKVLFLGFGHNDPNLAFLFSLLRRLFPREAPQHFSIGRQPSPEAGESPEESSRRYELWSKDWEERYRVRRVNVAEWSEVPGLLERVERRVVANSVLVSGSFPTESGVDEDRKSVEGVGAAVGKAMGAAGHRLVSGFGLTVGSAVLSAFLNALGADSAAPERRLLLRPFPQPSDGSDPRPLWPVYRENLVRAAGSVVFVGGAEKDGSGLISAGGVMEEYKFCLDQQRVPIPIGVTGYASADIWNIASREMSRWPWYPADAFKLLNDKSASNEALAGAVMKILAAMRAASP